MCALILNVHYIDPLQVYKYKQRMNIQIYIKITWEFKFGLQKMVCLLNFVVAEMLSTRLNY